MKNTGTKQDGATYPSYLSLIDSGKYDERLSKLRRTLESCRLCPRSCGVNRLKDEKGACCIGRRAVVSSAQPHFGEERPLVGRSGSGTIFFSGCNLKCLFCQNYEISQEPAGRPVTQRAAAVGSCAYHCAASRPAATPRIRSSLTFLSQRAASVGFVCACWAITCT